MDEKISIAKRFDDGLSSVFCPSKTEQSIPKTRILFAGTPTFAATHLEVLLRAQMNVVAVLTQPDKPSGRGRMLAPSPVKELARKAQLPVLQLASLKNTDEIKSLFETFSPDVVVDVAYGCIIPAALLSFPHYGFINVHPSLLPRWRGAAPIQHALLAGDPETGISIMQLDSGIDTGPVYFQKTCSIGNSDTALTLSHRLAKLGSESLLHVLKHLETFAPSAQMEEGACYAEKIDKIQGAIDWGKSAIVLDREIRAFNPWPVSFATIGGEVVRIHQAHPISAQPSHEPGTIVQLSDHSVDVATGDGLLQIQQMQFSGGKVLPISAILNGRKHFFELNKRFMNG